MKQRLAIFGGTFDPVHKGHLHAARSLIQELQLDMLHFLPLFQPVHRDSPQATTEQRLTMLSLALESESKMQLDVREIERGGPSYSLLSLQEYQREYPEHQLFFVIGSDAFYAIDTWYQWQQLFDITNFLVLKRPDSQLVMKTETAKFTEPRMITKTELLQSDVSGRVFVSEQPMLLASSTEVRKLIEVGDDFSHQLPQKVANYIKDHNIYRKDLLN